MPVKIRCKGCGKALNIPDRARGKTVKCPNCETALRIPAAKTAAPKGGKARQKQPVRQAVDDDDFLAGMDLRRAVDTRVRVCVKCGTEVDEEVIDCPECGHNVDTGVMSEVVRKKREREGPDPEEFWGIAWTGSFQYIKDNIPLVMRTAGYWVLFYTLLVWSICGMVLMGVGDLPNLVFWFSMAFLFYLGIVGWFWYANVKVIQHTMSPKRDKQIEKFHFSFFQCIALGLKSIIWPAVLFGPIFVAVMLFSIVPMALSGSSDFNFALMTLIDLGFRFVAILVFPLAMVHMSMPYTYKAWTPYHMAISLGKCILPALYWFVMALAAMLPVFVTGLILHVAWEGGLGVFFLDMFDIAFDLTDWVWGGFFDIPDEHPTQRKWYWKLLTLSVVWIPISIAMIPICFVAAFSSVFLMRANGYIGLYFHDKLDLVRDQQPNVPCGFWPRYLAHLVDILVLTIFLGAIEIGFFFLMLGAALLGLVYLLPILMVVSFGVRIFAFWNYYAKPESNVAWRGSIGKRALGIVVVTEDFKTMTYGQASGRFWVKLLLSQLLTLNIGLLVAAFTKRKQGLHDSMIKTLVVWEGDDERNEL